MEPNQNPDQSKKGGYFPPSRFFPTLQHYEHAALFKNSNVWEALDEIESYITLYQEKHKDRKTVPKVVGSVYIDQDKPVIIGHNTVIEHGAMIKGPTIIGNNCEIRSGAYIRGNVIISDNCVIGHSTELKNSILLHNVQVPHFNYVGDSILGHNVHLGAGAIVSNLRLDNKEIRVAVGG